MKCDALTKILLTVIALCLCAIVVRVWLPSPRPDSSTRDPAPKFDHVQMVLGPLGTSVIFFDRRTGDIWGHTADSAGTTKVMHSRLESLDKPMKLETEKSSNPDATTQPGTDWQP